MSKSQKLQEILEKGKSRKTHLEHIALIPEKYISDCDC
jgi:hypothetical protein